MVSIKLSFSNKTFYTLIGVLAVLIISGIVYAYNSSPANPSVFGHTVNEIEFIKEDGSTQSLADYIRDIADEQIAGGAINCPSTPNFVSGISESSNNYQSFDMPSGCKTETGCVIKQIINSSAGSRPRQYSYNQDSSTNKWWSTAYSGDYTNGNAKADKIIPAYNGLYLYDDGTENSPDQFSAKDTSSSVGQTIYICTFK